MDLSIGAIEAVSADLPSTRVGNVQARKVATQFEAVMLSQSFAEMFKGVKQPSVGGGGSAEKIWQSMLVDEMAKAVSEADTIGIADRIYRDMTR